MAMTIIAAVPCHYGNYIRIEFENFLPRCDV
jgi:hypothetical protein